MKAKQYHETFIGSLARGSACNTLSTRGTQVQCCHSKCWTPVLQTLRASGTYDNHWTGQLRNGH